MMTCDEVVVVYAGTYLLDDVDAEEEDVEPTISVRCTVSSQWVKKTALSGWQDALESGDEGDLILEAFDAIDLLWKVFDADDLTLETQSAMKHDWQGELCHFDAFPFRKMDMLKNWTLRLEEVGEEDGAIKPGQVQIEESRREKGLHYTVRTRWPKFRCFESEQCGPHDSHWDDPLYCSREAVWCDGVPLPHPERYKAAGCDGV